MTSNNFAELITNLYDIEVGLIRLIKHKKRPLSWRWRMVDLLKS